MEYTYLAIAVVVIVIGIDFLLNIRVTAQRRFWLFMLVMFMFKLLVNGYLTGRPIVLYSEEFFLGIRLLTIPVEDFLFGFSLITLSVVLWEHFTRKSGSKQEPIGVNR